MKNILEEYRTFAVEALITYGSPFLNTSIKVLKTDCNNEANSDFPIVPHIWHRCIICCVDNSDEIIKKAIDKFPILAVRKGDIRYLPFPDEYFDVVLDFSTIDHVYEYQLVLKEYKRVLVDNGILSLVAWLDKEQRHVPSSVDSGQYYFNETLFSKCVENNFKVLKKENYPWAVGGDGILTRFLCRKT